MKLQQFKRKLDFRRISNYVRREIVLQCLELSVHSNAMQLSSRLIRMGCKPLTGSGNRSKPQIWTLGKEGLNEDLLVTIEESGWAVPVDFSRRIPKAIARHYLPPNIDDNTYVTQDAELTSAKEIYREVWRNIFRAMPSDARPNAITTGNFGYYAERELAHAAECENIPFIAMHKECLKSEGRLAFFKTVYQRRGKFEGRKILVYNNREKELQISASVARPDQVLVCGMPRLDRVHRWRKLGVVREERPRTLLALGFTPKTGLPRIPRKGECGSETRFEYLDPSHEQMGWNNLFYNYHEVLVKIARDHPDWVIQLKLKARHRDAEPSINLLKQMNPSDNLQVIVGGDPLQLILNADVVSGFNTTAVLEGLAAGLPVVTPMYDEVVDPVMRDFAASFEDATHTPNDPASMYSIITELMQRRLAPLKELPQNVLEMLDRWVGNPDGEAGNRVRCAFEREMGLHR